MLGRAGPDDAQHVVFPGDRRDLAERSFNRAMDVRKCVMPCGKSVVLSSGTLRGRQTGLRLQRLA